MFLIILVNYNNPRAHKSFTVRLCKIIWSGEDGEAAAVSVTVGLAESVSGRL